MDNQAFISVSEAAQIAGVTTESIRYLCKLKAIRYKKHGKSFLPCKEDIERYVNKMSTIHPMIVDVGKLEAQLLEKKKTIRKELMKADEFLKELKITPTRIRRMSEVLYAILRQYEHNKKDVFDKKELEVLFRIFQGDSFDDVAQSMQQTVSNARIIWNKVLRKLVEAKNEIEIRDAEIDALRKTIKNRPDHKELRSEVLMRDGEIALLQKKINDLQNTCRYLAQKSNIFKLLKQPIESLDLSTRVKRGLHRANINTVYDLVQKRRVTILAAPSIGSTSLKEVDQWLDAHGLSYEMKFPDNILKNIDS